MIINDLPNQRNKVTRYFAGSLDIYNLQKLARWSQAVKCLAERAVNWHCKARSWPLHKAFQQRYSWHGLGDLAWLIADSLAYLRRKLCQSLEFHRGSLQLRSGRPGERLEVAGGTSWPVSVCAACGEGISSCGSGCCVRFCGIPPAAARRVGSLIKRRRWLFKKSLSRKA
jgi:hypothetical protein